MLGVSTVEGSRISLALNHAQTELGKDTESLSSGLRINSAADDPSGLAISTSLAVQAQGLDTGAQSISTASNALTVADGALQTVTDILQRMRQLTVEGGNDLMSISQLNDVQTEIEQLKLEINRIAQNTSFNGISLLNGTFDTSEAQAASVVAIKPAADLYAKQTGQVLVSGVDYVTNAQPGNGSGGGNPADAYVQFSVAGVNIAAGTEQYRQVAYSNDPTFGANQDETYTLSNGTYGEGLIFPDPAPDNREEIVFTQNAVTTADIGVTDAFEVTAAKAAGGGNSAQVGVGDDEGDTIEFNAPNVSTASLDISNVSVLPGNRINSQFITTPGSSNEYAVEDSLYRIDGALDTVDGARAKLGSQIVALQETQTNSATAANAYTSSASNIRDANIGATTTDYTKAQILVQVGTSVLSQNNTDSRLVLDLFNAA